VRSYGGAITACPRLLSVMRTPVALPPAQAVGVTMQRRRFKQTLSLRDRLSAEAQRLRNEARMLSPGLRRQRLVRKARQLETASEIDLWLGSSGLRAPS
jgi:hypothetical protein